jgi:hypothetical protein
MPFSPEPPPPTQLLVPYTHTPLLPWRLRFAFVSFSGHLVMGLSRSFRLHPTLPVTSDESWIYTYVDRKAPVALSADPAG